MIDGELGLELEHEMRTMVEVRDVRGYREPRALHLMQVRRSRLRFRQRTIQRHLSSEHNVLLVCAPTSTVGMHVCE